MTSKLKAGYKDYLHSSHALKTQKDNMWGEGAKMTRTIQHAI